MIHGGEPELNRLKSGISENNKTVATKNLGELFREARAKHSFNKSNSIKVPFSTGIDNLTLYRNKHTKQGFQWRYSYKDGKGRRRSIVRANLLSLIDEVTRRNLKWRINDEEKARKTAKKAGIKFWEIK